MPTRFPRLKASILTAIVLGAGIWAFGYIEKVHAKFQAIESAENLRDIGVVLMRYTARHEGQYPARLSDLIISGDIDARFLIVPWGTATIATGTPNEQADQVNAGGHCSYAYLGAGLSLVSAQELVNPQHMVILYEDDGRNPTGLTCCSFVDGHSEWLTVQELIKYTVIPLMQKCHSLESTTKPVIQGIR